MATNRFSVPLAKLVEGVKLDLETVARKSTLALFRSVVEKSPVGNPDLWAANAGLSRTDPSYVGKGYVGGRFRANWNFSYGSPDGGATESTDKTRGLEEANKAASMNIGGVAYLSNGLPYAKRLEYGWSKQTPAGMVRISALEFEDQVRQIIRGAA